MPLPRRGFLRSVAAVPLAPTALATQGAPPAAFDGKDGVAEALAEAVKRQFAEHLDAAELETVKKELARSLERGERLRNEARLRNADEPAGLFHARPPEQRGRRR